MMWTFRRSNVWIALLFGIRCATAFADSLIAIEHKFRRGDNECEARPHHYFGGAIDLAWPRAVIGSPGEYDSDRHVRGVADIFAWNDGGWTREARLRRGPTSDFEYFGWNVAIDGDTAAVASMRELPDGRYEPSVHIFVRDGDEWSRRQVLGPFESKRWMDLPIALRDHLLVVGMNFFTNSERNGYALVFARSKDEWVLDATLVGDSPTPPEGSSFGSAVATDGQAVVVGEPYAYDGPNYAAGAAHIYARSNQGWSRQARLAFPYAPGTCGFGYSVAIDGDAVLIGQYCGGLSYQNDDAAFIFRQNGDTWLWEGFLSPNGPAPSLTSFFGIDVDLKGDTAVVATPHGADEPPLQYGRLEVYRRTELGWIGVASLRSPAGANDAFAYNVSMDGGRILSGMQAYDGPVGESQGAAAIFAHSDEGWDAGELLTLQCDRPSLGDYVGNSVALADGVVYVSAGQDRARIERGLGSVLTYERNPDGWNESASVFPSGDGSNYSFGSQLASDGTRLVAAFSGIDPAVVIFERGRDGWSEAARVYSPAGGTFERFGSSLAIQGDWLVVGASDASREFESQGVAYLYHFDGENWNLAADFAAPNPSEGAYFGYSVALDGTTVVVGAYRGQQSDRPYSGAAYVFEHNGGVWTQQTLIGEGLRSGGWFGISVAIFGDTVAVGASRYIANAADEGRAFVYRKRGSEGWVQEARIRGDYRLPVRFGTAVSLDEVGLAITAAETVDGASGAGAAYYFRYDGQQWVRAARFFASDSHYLQGFGNSVYLRGDEIVVGAWLDGNGSGAPLGSAYHFQLRCPGDPTGDWQVDISDLIRTLSSFGSQTGADWSAGDGDHDGDVDIEDLANQLAHFGSVCP